MVTIRINRSTKTIRVTHRNNRIVLRHVGPRGLPGSQGPQGPQGPPGDSGNAVWGLITGDIEDQTDLQAALATKVDLGGDLGGTPSNPLAKDRTTTFTLAKTGTAADFVCDGTADNVQINDALSQLDDLGGGDLLIRHSATAYDIAATILIPDDVRIICEKGVTFRLADGANTDVLRNADTVSGNTGFEIHGLRIDANQTNNTGTLYGIYFEKVSDSRLQDVSITGAKTNNLYLKNCDHIQGARLSVTDAGTEGMILEATSDCAFDSLETSDNATAGLQLYNGSHRNSFVHLKVLDNGLYGVLNGTGNLVDNNYNSFDDFLVQGNGDDAFVMDNGPYWRANNGTIRMNGGHSGDEGFPIDKSPYGFASNVLVELNRASGFQLKNGSNNCHFVNCISRNNSNPAVGGLSDGAGMVIEAGITGTSVIGGSYYSDEASPSQRRGIHLTGAGCDYNTIIGARVYGNSVNQIERASTIGTHNSIWLNPGANDNNTNTLISRVDNQPLSVTNSLADSAIAITQTGNTSASPSGNAALKVDNTANTGIGLGIYTDKAAGAAAAPLMMQNNNPAWDYSVALANLINKTVHNAFRIQQDGALMASRAAFLLEATTQQDTANAYGLFALRQANSASTNRAMWVDNSGSGEVSTFRSALGPGLIIDQNGPARALLLDHDDTGSTPTLGLDRDGNSTSQIIGSDIDVDNVGTGGAIGQDIKNVTATGGTVIGQRIAAPSGGTSNYALQLADTGGTAAGGLTFATGTSNLYRPSANTLRTDGKLIVGNVLDLNSTQINNVANPTNAQDAATKAYADTQDSNRAYRSNRRDFQDRDIELTSFQTGHGWTTSGAVNGTSTNVNDTADFIKGTQAAKVVSNGTGGGGANLQQLNRSAVDLTGKALRFLIKVDDPQHLLELNFLVGSNTSFSNSLKWQTLAKSATTKLYPAGEWVYVTVGWADLHSASGTYSLDSHRAPSTKTGFTQVRFQIIDTGTPVTVHVQSVEIIKDTLYTYPKGVVSVSFDDSWDNQYTLGKPVLDKYGIRGTVFVIAGNVGTAGRLTLAQLKKMQAEGWEIAGHAYSQTLHDDRYTAHTAAEVEADLKALKAWLMDNGFDSDSYAYPGGDCDLTTDGVSIEYIVSKYFYSARTVMSAYGSASNLLSEHVPVPRPYRMLAQTAISDISSGQDLPANLIATGGELDVVSTQGAWHIVTFHIIKDLTGNVSDIGEISVAQLDTIMANLVSRGIDVLPIGEVMHSDIYRVPQSTATIANFDAQARATLSGTTNQVNYSSSTGVISLPQNIHTAATPQFAGLTLTSSLSIASLTGLLKASSGVVSAATSGTDYAPATSGTSLLKGNGSGGFSSAVSGTDYLPASAIGAWQTWTPTQTGFSADPAGGIYRYRLTGDEVELEIRQPNDGTSNATTFTISLPVTAATVTDTVWQQMCRVRNNGAFVTNPGYGVVSSGGTTLELFINTGTTAWGTANGKRVDYIRIKYRWQ